MTYNQSGDAMEFFGCVAKWLESAPESVKPYGTFYVRDVALVFDGEELGRFRVEDDAWTFEATGGAE